MPVITGSARGGSTTGLASSTSARSGIARPGGASSRFSFRRSGYSGVADFLRAPVWSAPTGSHWLMYGLSQFKVGAGAGTVFMTTGIDDTEDEISFPAPRSFRVLKFNVDCVDAPGPGQTFTYRLRRKALGGSWVNAGISATISGTSVDAQADGAADYPRGSRFCVALDKSDGAVATKHGWAIEYELL